MGHYVFGYGSLLERWDPGNGLAAARVQAAPRLTELHDYRRTWNVAMDNTRTVPGYKYYVDAATGERGDWFVSFLNVVPDLGSRVNGVLFAVTDDSLAELDERERNYDRVEISDRLSPAVDGEAWVYTGTGAAVDRFEAGALTDRAVVPREYYRSVIDDFEAAGANALERFIELTDPPTCPVLDLERVDLPEGSGA
jgi:cation transport regulator ChaC